MCLVNALQEEEETIGQYLKTDIADQSDHSDDSVIIVDELDERQCSSEINFIDTIEKLDKKLKRKYIHKKEHNTTLTKRVSVHTYRKEDKQKKRSKEKEHSKPKKDKQKGEFKVG